MSNYTSDKEAPWKQYQKYIETVIIEDGCTTLGAQAFYACYNLRTIQLPDSLISVGGQAFYGCSSLLNATIPDGVRSIGYSAFYNCSSLTSVTIPEGVTRIEGQAFYYCSSLASVTIPASVSSIGNDSFSYCSSISGFVVDENNSYFSSDMSGCLFNKTKTVLRSYPAGNPRSSFTIPNSVTSISMNAFHSCKNLTDVTVSDSVTSIGENAFYNCSSLTSVIIPDSVTSIGRNAFKSTKIYGTATNWESDVLYIGNHLIDTKENISSTCSIKSGTITIADYAFYSRLSLTGVTIPNSVSIIGQSAFFGCSNLSNISIGNGVKTIKTNAFYGTRVYNNESNWSNGVLYIGAYLIGSKSSVPSTYSIRAGTICVADRAFYNRSSMTSITIPSSVTSIGKSAFEYCNSLERVDITDIATWCKISFSDYYSNPM